MKIRFELELGEAVLLAIINAVTLVIVKALTAFLHSNRTPRRKRGVLVLLELPLFYHKRSVCNKLKNGDKCHFVL